MTIYEILVYQNPFESTIQLIYLIDECTRGVAIVFPGDNEIASIISTNEFYGKQIIECLRRRGINREIIVQKFTPGKKVERDKIDLRILNKNIERIQEEEIN